MCNGSADLQPLRNRRINCNSLLTSTLEQMLTFQQIATAQELQQLNESQQFNHILQQLTLQPLKLQQLNILQVWNNYCNL